MEKVSAPFQLGCLVKMPCPLYPIFKKIQTVGFSRQGRFRILIIVNLSISRCTYLKYTYSTSPSFNTNNQEKGNRISLSSIHNPSGKITSYYNLFHNTISSNHTTLNLPTMDGEGTSQVGDLVNKFKQATIDLGNTSDVVIVQQDDSNEKVIE